MADRSTGCITGCYSSARTQGPLVPSQTERNCNHSCIICRAVECRLLQEAGVTGKSLLNFVLSDGEVQPTPCAC